MPQSRYIFKQLIIASTSDSLLINKQIQIKKLTTSLTKRTRQVAELRSKEANYLSIIAGQDEGAKLLQLQIAALVRKLGRQLWHKVILFVAVLTITTIAIVK